MDCLLQPGAKAPRVFVPPRSKETGFPKLPRFPYGVDVSALCLAELFKRRTNLLRLNLLRLKQQAECRERGNQS
jgi:hypothetical protein